MSVAWAAYRLLAPCLGALAPAARVFTSLPEQQLWNERMGDASLEGGCHAWIHSASLGEASAVGPLVRELRAFQSRARLYLTANTRTGRTRLRGLGLPASLAPIDSPQAVRRFFEGVRPERLMLVETELWPHWLLRARSDRIPVVVVSARLSRESLPSYRRLGPDFRALMSDLAAVLCQSAEDERRWIALGARPERTAVVGNLKNDAIPRTVESRGAARESLGLDRDRPLLVLGSLRPGEVRILARAWRALPEERRDEWQVVAVPRHARASGELREEADRVAQPWIAEGAPSAGAWRWDDRSGVLMSYYAAGDVAFVGGSLLPYGGHNPIEPASASAAVIMGPHYESQIEAVRDLASAQAIELVANEAELAVGLERLLADPALRLERGRAARALTESRRGAARRAVRQLVTWNLWPVA
jgi:3-deoxy-D-manno-octulosonic-acid transferase